MNEGSAVLLGNRIRDHRERRRWNKADLARRAGVSASYVTRVEAGAFGTPSIDRIGAIASALGVEISVLTGPPAPDNPDDDALLRKMLEKKLGNRPNAEMIHDLLDQTAGKAPVDPDTRQTILDVFGTLTRSLPKHHD